MPEPIQFTKEETSALLSLLPTITFSGDRQMLRKLIDTFDSIEAKLKASLPIASVEPVTSDGKSQSA